MRIGTWNVEYPAGKDRNPLRLARLKAANADIWVLTETHDELDRSSRPRTRCAPSRRWGHLPAGALKWGSGATSDRHQTHPRDRQGAGI